MENQEKTLAAISDEGRRADTRKPVIQVKKVYKDFLVGKRTVNILKDINFEIKKGEFIMLFGPSGSGKSTLLNAIIGLELPTRGSVVVNGSDITRLKPDDRAVFRMKNIGVIYQRAEWIRSLNVLQNVCFPLSVSGVSRAKREAKAYELLKKFGQDVHAVNRPTELSGGEQQRVSIARALVTNPNILIADEPTGNLDSKSAADVMAVFRILNEESDITIIMVTHNLDLVKFATRAVYIRDGQLISGDTHGGSE